MVWVVQVICQDVYSRAKETPVAEGPNLSKERAEGKIVCRARVRARVFSSAKLTSISPGGIWRPLLKQRPPCFVWFSVSACETCLLLQGRSERHAQAGLDLESLSAGIVAQGRGGVLMGSRKKRQRSGGGTVLVLAVLLFVSAGAALFLYFHQGEAAVRGWGAGSDLKTVALEPVTVNLADSDSRRYLRAGIVLEYADREVGDELAEKGHRVRDAAMAVLRAKTVADLKDEGAMKGELVEAANRVLERGRVTGVYFKEFVIQ